MLARPPVLTSTLLTVIGHGALVALGLLAGCGSSGPDEEVVRAVSTRRAMLAGLASTLPAPSTAPGAPLASIAPAIDFREDSRESNNVELLMFDQLSNPAESRSQPERFDAMLGGDLLHCLRASAGSAVWPLADGVCERALARPWTVVLRVVRYQPPVAIDDDTYGPGLVVIEGLVLESASGAQRGRFLVQAEPASTVTATLREDRSRRESITAFAHSTLWSNARRAVRDALMPVASRFVLRGE